MISGANSLYMSSGVSSRPAAAGTMEACAGGRRAVAALVRMHGGVQESQLLNGQLNHAEQACTPCKVKVRRKCPHRKPTLTQVTQGAPITTPISLASFMHSRFCEEEGRAGATEERLRQ